MYQLETKYYWKNIIKTMIVLLGGAMTIGVTIGGIFDSLFLVLILCMIGGGAWGHLIGHINLWTCYSINVIKIPDNDQPH